MTSDTTEVPAEFADSVVEQLHRMQEAEKSILAGVSALVDAEVNIAELIGFDTTGDSDDDRDAQAS